MIRMLLPQLAQAAAVAGHAGVAFNHYMHDGTDASREEAVAHVRKTLTALAEDQPAAFKALVAALRQA